MEGKIYKKVPIEISARHVHLSQKDLEELFGKGYKLKALKQLSLPKEFAAEERVTLKSGEREIENVRVVGPARKETQIEISHSDARFLRINPPVRDSGDIENSPGINIIGPKKEISVSKGVIIPWRHIHCSKKQAAEIGLVDGELVSIKTKSNHPVTFHNIRVHIIEDDCFCLHLNTEEGNIAGIPSTGEGVILEIKEEKEEGEF